VDGEGLQFWEVVEDLSQLNIGHVHEVEMFQEFGEDISYFDLLNTPSFKPKRSAGIFLQKF